MGKAAEYRYVAWDCLKIAEATSSARARALMLALAQHSVRLAAEAERNTRYQAGGYRAKAYDCASRAESINDPERRADMLRFAGMWLSLADPIKDELRGAYELPPQRAA